MGSFKYINNTVKYYFSHYDVMWKRLFLHLFNKKSDFKIEHTSKLEWCADLFFYILDISGIPLVYALISPLYKWNLRQLDDIEKEVAKDFFKDTIEYDYVWLHTSMPNRIRKFALAYVSQNTINYQGEIRASIFIHEMVHVWQYQRYGIVYIYRALKAQNTKEGYDYGSSQGVSNGMYRGKPYSSFNFEQQAQIMEDYYNLRQMETVMPLSYMEMAGYEYYYMQLINK